MRKSRLWTAVSAVVGLAALVVLASCQGPARRCRRCRRCRRQGLDTGPDRLAAAPSGPAGTTDNCVAGGDGYTDTGVSGARRHREKGQQFDQTCRHCRPRTVPASTDWVGSQELRSSVGLELKAYFTDAESPSLGLSYTATFLQTRRSRRLERQAAITGVVAGGQN